jgi:hypothetical protein
VIYAFSGFSCHYRFGQIGKITEMVAFSRGFYVRHPTRVSLVPSYTKMARGAFCFARAIVVILRMSGVAQVGDAVVGFFVVDVVYDAHRPLTVRI